MIKKIIFVFFLLAIGSIFLVDFGGDMHGGCGNCYEASYDLDKLSRNIFLLQQAGKYSENISSSLRDELNRNGSPRKDPWGNDYLYATFYSESFQCFVVWTFGSDGIPGGELKHQQDIFKLGQCKKVVPIPTSF